MGTVGPNSGAVPAKDGENGRDSRKEIDAGALFVLKSRGSWLHCGYHLTTAIVAPALLSIPFAMALVGWVGGVLCLTMAGTVTFYSYNLLSMVLEHHAHLGKRQLRFRDMAHDILGPGWGRYFVGPLQLGICYGAVIACTLLGGQSLKFIYLLSEPEGSMQLYHFVIIFGALMLENPKKHPPSTILSLQMVLIDFLELFNAISIIATTYGNGIIPEIQATIAPPVTGKMFKGLLVLSSVLQNFMVNGKPLVPKWFLLMTNVFTLVQVIAVVLTYLQPTNVVLERKFADPKMDQFSLRNVVPRLIFRSLSIVIATLLAAMLPFFGDIMALFGAFGCIPLDFILPMVFYNVTFKPSRKSIVFWVNTSIAVISTVLSLVGAVASVRQIVLDAKTYRLFANM
ncbi:transmembrane amino acid transporter family protein [Actinidia rufa]|uniref:Transmembrane amino acid transporter family protein n=1 Tax=Actinidia rufa TaxID=165716 RepID=A0A7J0DUS1_9ERIC|nr:transmembrane amino acid transporter family protein [Actinidia rufa]